MLIGIISDTHDQKNRTRRAVELLIHGGATALFHCGDLTQPSIVEVCAVLPSFFVFGNNDTNSIEEIRSAIARPGDAICLEWGGTVELTGKRIAMTHGHRTHEERRLLAAEPHYLFSGHSHQVGDWREGTTRRINPGALYRAKSFTVALLNTENDELRFIEVRA